MGALFDPEPYIVARTLIDLPVEKLVNSVWRPALIDRLVSLLAAGRRVLAALTRPVSELVRLIGTDDVQISYIVQRLKSDRSWEVSRLVSTDH
jgi:hypothetical protein